MHTAIFCKCYAVRVRVCRGSCNDRPTDRVMLSLYNSILMLCRTIRMRSLKSRRRDRYLCVACRPHTRPQRFSPRRRELARAPQTHHTHRKPRHPTLASRSKRECAPLQHAAHVTQAMSSSTSTHHVASNAHKAPRNAPGTLSRPSRAHSNAPIPAQ